MNKVACMSTNVLTKALETIANLMAVRHISFREAQLGVQVLHG